MKTSILLIGFICFFNQLHADVVPPNYKRIPYCVIIQNADSFPGVELLSYKSGTTPKEIKSSDCVNNCCSYDPFYICPGIFALNKEYVLNTGINNINVNNNKIALPSNISFPKCSYQELQIDSPQTNIREYYRILGFTKTSAIIYLFKRVTTYTDNHKDSVCFQKPFGYNNLYNSITDYSDLNKAKTSQLLIYPSPSQEYLNIYCIDNRIGNIKIEIFNLSGKKLSEYAFMKNQDDFRKSISIENLPAGIYNLTYTFGNSIEQRKFLKK